MTQHWGSLGLLLIRKQKRFYYKLSQQASCEHVVELVRYKPVKGWWWSYEYMKIIYMNYGVKNYMKDDHRSYRRNFCSFEKKYVFINLKKDSTLYWSCRISIEPVVKLMWQIQIYAVTPYIKRRMVQFVSNGTDIPYFLWNKTVRIWRTPWKVPWMSRCLILCFVEETLVTAKPVWSDSISDRLKVNMGSDARALKTSLI